MPGLNIHFSWKMLIAVAFITVGPCVFLAVRTGGPRGVQEGGKPLTTHSDETNSVGVVEGQPGPWGRLLYANLMLDLPDEFVLLPSSDQPVRWFFKGYSRDGVIDLLKSADLTDSQVESFAQDAVWSEKADGTWVEPRDEQVLELTPGARSRIYSVLIEIPENSVDLDPVAFRPETIDAQLSDSGLQPASVHLLKSLLYQNGDSPWLIFIDRDVALRQLPDDRERRLFVKALSRRATVMARLVVDANTDVEALGGYWGVGGRKKDIVPLLKSLGRVEGGWNVGLVYLLPSFIRERLCTYPFPSSGTTVVKEDCFWSAFNAFNQTPDDRFCDMKHVREVLDREYYTIFEPTQLGDLVLLATPGNEVVHAAVYIADDLVFTKNGFHYTQPWILMHMNDMIETYAARHPGSGELKTRFFRKTEN